MYLEKSMIIWNFKKMSNTHCWHLTVTIGVFVMVDPLNKVI